MGAVLGVPGVHGALESISCLFVKHNNDIYVPEVLQKLQAV